MNGEIRRSEILQKLQNSGRAISGSALAKTFGVSRQVIVQDIALLRAQGIHITPTNRGYLLERSTGRATRVFKVIHTEEEVEDELTRIVDLGGTIKDVFIYHRVYGVVRGELNIRSRLDVSLRLPLPYRNGRQRGDSGCHPGGTSEKQLSGAAAAGRTGAFRTAGRIG